MSQERIFTELLAESATGEEARKLIMAAAARLRQGLGTGDMSRKTSRMFITAAVVLGIFIFAVRRIHLSPATDPKSPTPTSAHANSRTLPSSFTLKIGANMWDCALNGTVLNCQFRAALPRGVRQ